MKTELTVAELRQILENVDYGTLSRDELEHALTACFNFPVEEDDRDVDLVGYLHMCLKVEP